MANGDNSSTQLIVSATGLNTDQSEFSKLPAGALRRADNISLTRKGLIESRRGFRLISQFTLGVTKLLEIGKTLVLLGARTYAFDATPAETKNGIIPFDQHPIDTGEVSKTDQNAIPGTMPDSSQFSSRNARFPTSSVSCID